MASFKERYEELFGPTPDYDPIEVGDLEDGANRRAINIQDKYGDMSSPRPQRAIPTPPAPRVEEQGTFSGLMKTGGAMLAEGALGVPEYLARQAGGTGVAESIKGVRDDVAGWREGVTARMNPEVIEMKGREFTTLDPDKTIWQGSPLEVGEALLYKLVEQVPMTLATLVPGGVMMRAGMGAKALTYLGASEAGLSVGFIANDITDAIGEMSDKELSAESPRFAALVQERGAEAGRQQFIAEAQGMAPVIGGLLVGAVSATAGRFLTPVLDKAGAPLSRRITTGALSEGLVQEGPQETIEQIVGNVARAAFDGDVQALDGALEAYVGGAAVGGPMGGIFAGLAGNAPADEADDGSATPTERDVPDPTSSFPDIFGEGLLGQERDFDTRDPLDERKKPLTYAEELRAEGIETDLSQSLLRSQGVGGALPIGSGPNFTPIDPAIAAAVSANIRTDGTMDELPMQGGATAEQLGDEQARAEQVDQYDQYQGERNQRQGDAMSGLMGALQNASGEPFQPAGPPQGEMPTEQRELLPTAERSGATKRAPVLKAAPAAPLPDELDTPSREPIRDLKAQLAALDAGEREGVYLSAANLEGLSIDLGERIVVEDFDGKGGVMVFADEATADHAIEAIDAGFSMQEVIGFLTGAGDGKSMSPDAVVVQKTDEAGSVIRESQVANQEEAEQVAAEWSDESENIPLRGGDVTRAPTNVRILSMEEALGRRESEIAAEQSGQEDLPIFSEPVTSTTTQEPVTETQGEREPRSTKGYRVRFTDDSGERIEDKSFGTYKVANTYANKLAKDNGLTRAEASKRITLAPIRTLPRQQRTEPVTRTSTKKEGRAAPAKTEGEKMADELRRTHTFEERAPLIGPVSAASSKDEAVENLEALAVKELKRENQQAPKEVKATESGTLGGRKKLTVKAASWRARDKKTITKRGDRSPALRVDGFFDPSVYEFKDSAFKEQYADAFKELVRLDKVGGDKTAVRKRLQQIRQIAQPIRKTQRLIDEARRLKPSASEVTAMEQFTDEGENKDLDESVDISLSTGGANVPMSPSPETEMERTQEKSKSSALRRTGAAIAEGVDSTDVIGELPLTLTREDIAAMDEVELEVAFEQTLNYFRGRGDSQAQIDLRRYEPKRGQGGEILKPPRPNYRKPIQRGKKEKAIRRALVARTNQSETNTRAKGVKLVTDATGRGKVNRAVSTAGLASRNLAPDESGYSKLVREQKAKRLYAELQKAVVVAKRRVKKLKPERARNKDKTLTEAEKSKMIDEKLMHPDGDLTRLGQRVLLAGTALEAHIQLAEAAIAAGHQDTNLLDLVESLITLFNKELDVSKLYGLYIAQAHIGPAVAGWDHSVWAILNSNKKLLAKLKRQEKLSRFNKNQYYKTFIVPVLEKLSAHVQVAVLEPQSSLNPTGLPQRVIDRYLELRKDHGHEAAVDNMGDIFKLFPQMKGQEVAAGMALAEERKRRVYQEGLGGARGPVNTSTDRGGFTENTAGKMESTYKPTLEEMQGMAWALQRWQGSSVDKEIYAPVKKLLKDFGFEFDENGELIVEQVTVEGVPVGIPVYTPYGKTAMETRNERLAPARAEAAAEAEAAAAAEKAELARVASGKVQLAGIYARFLKVVNNKKSTIGALIDAEMRMIAALQENGYGRQGSAFATLQTPQGKTFSYRKVASGLNRKKFKKGVAVLQMQAGVKPEYAVADTKDQILAENAGTLEQANELTAAESPDVEYGYFMEALDKTGDLTADETKSAAMLLGDLLANGTTDAQTVLSALSSELNPNGVFGTATEKLLQAGDFSGVKVEWEGDGTTRITKSGVPAQFHPATNTVVLSKAKFQKKRGDGTPYTDAYAVHVALHEIMHSATYNALRTNKPLADMMKMLRDQAARAFPGSDMYGLQLDRPIDEFVVEMFVNRDLQAIAKSIQVQEMRAETGLNKILGGKFMSLWDAFTGLLKQVLGFDSDYEGSVFDVVMASSDVLFEQAGMLLPGASNRPLNFDADSQIGRVYDKFIGQTELGQQLEDRATDVKGALGQGVISSKLTTMEQLRDRYSEQLGGLSTYIDNFFARNSRNAELMEPAEALSREWTALHGDPALAETSLEVSQVGTESTLYQINPTASLTHDSNKHISSSKMKKKHRELSARYQAMDQKGKDLWKDLQSFYKSSLRRETALLKLNALRGVVRMDEAAFDKKYNKENITKFETFDQIKDEFGDMLPKGRDDIVQLIQRLSSVPEMERGVYFPLMRYGEYAVYATKLVESKTFRSNKEANKHYNTMHAIDPTYKVGIEKTEGGRYEVKTEEVQFATMESFGEAKRKSVEFQAEGYDVQDTQKKRKTQSETAIASNAALSSILGSLEGNAAAQAAVKALYLRNLADTSFRKREITRKNRDGVDYTLQHRNFANYAKQSAYYTAQLEFGSKMGDAIREMNEALDKRREVDIPGGYSTNQLSNVRDSILERDEASANPFQVGKWTRRAVATTQFMMLTSASYHLINSSQPWMVTYPIVSGRHGYGNTFSAMKAAQKLIANPLLGQVKNSWGGVKALWDQNKAEEGFGVFTELTKHIQDNDPANAPDYISMLQELRNRHILEVSPLTELREIGSGIEGKFSSRLLDASRLMSHIVEVNNRVLTAIASYELELVKNGGDKEAAIKYAGKIVSTTQFNYSSANKPPLFQKLPIMFQFMQWTQHMYSLLISNFVAAHRAGWMTRTDARQSLFGLLGTHAAVGGMTGLILQPIKVAIGMVALALRDDDDPIDASSALSGEWFDRKMTEAFHSAFGTTAAMVMSKGLPTLAGGDLSDRMSLGTLYFVDLRQDNAQSFIGSLLLSFGGASVNQAGQFYDAFTKFQSGDYGRAFERSMPKFLRDMSKAGRFMQEGLVNNAGDTVLDTKDMGYWEIALQAVGFTPASSSQFYAGQTAMKDVERFVRARKSQLLKDYRMATTGAERMAVRREIQAFNKRYRLDPINYSAVTSTIQSKRERERQYDRYGVNIDRKKIRQYSGFGDPYR